MDDADRQPREMVRGCAWKPSDDTGAARAGEFQARKTQAVIPPVRDLS
jgi:hypothetical protein